MKLCRSTPVRVPDKVIVEQRYDRLTYVLKDGVTKRVMGEWTEMDLVEMAPLDRRSVAAFLLDLWIRNQRIRLRKPS